MQHVIAQLETVRRLGRLMLIARRLLQFLAVFCVVAVFCGFADFLLRFPGWMRLVIGVGFAAFALLWLVTHLGRAFGFAPDLGTLALRAERLFPQLTGVLASGVEFATHSDQYADPQRTAALARSSVSQVETKLGRESLAKLLNPTPTIRVGALALLAVLIFAGIIIIAPASSAIAAQRWLLPLGETEWPRRTAITSLVTEQVQPADAPMRLAARVDKGYSEGMRAWVYYRVQNKAGDYRQWQSVLMSEQAVTAAAPGEPAAETGMFERLVDLTPDFAEWLAAGGSRDDLPADGVLVEFYFKAGDDFTKPQTLRVVPRPAVKSVTVTITPPEYARGLVNEETIALDKLSGRTAAVSGLEGSTVRITVETNKPLAMPVAGDDLTRGMMPGLRQPNMRFDVSQRHSVVDPKGKPVRDVVREGDRIIGPDGKPITDMTDLRIDIALDKAHLASNAQPVSIFTATFTLTASIETPIRLLDVHGLENLSDRTYRIDMRADVPPTVAMIEPASDEMVLATAVVPLESTARDDVAVESLALEALLPPLAASLPQSPGESRTLETVTGRADRLTAGHAFDLSKLGVKPGDIIVLTAIARDGYDLDGKKHDAVRSTPRTLRIVDSATLTNQIRNELAGLRQQAMRIEARQQELKASDPATAQPRQEQLTQTLARTGEAVEQLGQRVKRNKLNDPQMTELLNRTKSLLNQAGAESQSAAQKLDQARREEKDSAQQKAHQAQAGEHQDNVAQALKEITNLLDEGKSALALQSQLRQLDQAQKQLAEQTRELLPRTAGRDADELSDKDRKDLERIAQEQKNLAQQADDLVKQMKAAAEALDKQGDKPQDKAAAAALNEAANTAQREGLKEKMDQAAQDTQENKLSQAGQQQQEASDTMQQMMSQMQGQQQKQQEMLRRMLAKLEESISKLLEQQKAQLARLMEARELPQLADPQATLRRNTMAVAQEARDNEKTAGAAKLIDQAAQSQSDAIFFLRGNQKDPAITAQTDAVRNLEDALAMIRAQKKKEEQAEQQQQREELKAEYEKLAKQQDELTRRTELLADEKELNRRQRAELAQLAQAQEELQGEVNKLKEKVGDTLVFQHLHTAIDEAATIVTGKLRAIEASQEVLFHQQTISQSLLLMAKALDEANKDENPFENPQDEQAGEQQDGQPGEAKPKLVPDLAELRLLRAMQESLYLKTRAIGEGKLPADQRGKIIEGLSEQQLRIRILGEAVIRKLTNQGNDALPQVQP